MRGQIGQQAMPILVGRFVGTIDVGCSCMLSGGSQLSSGRRGLSKNAQVFARQRARYAPPGCELDFVNFLDRLIHQEIAGEASQSSNIGSAAGKAAGCCNEQQ